jgi:iron complex transport system substrate-binding protein
VLINQYVQIRPKPWHGPRGHRPQPQPFGLSRDALVIGLLLLAGATNALAAAPQRVMSINLCTDQLLLTLAEPNQIASLSWLAFEEDDAALAGQAVGFERNFGSAEELMRISPDLVLAGQYTANFAGGLARRLGFPVLEIPPANNLDEVMANLRLLGTALDRSDHTEQVIETMQVRIDTLIEQQPTTPTSAIVVRPGGFTVGANTLAHNLMELAGLYNVAAAAGLDRWGSLSMEALLTSGADLLIVSNYRSDAPSLTNETLQHPAFQTLQKRLKVRQVPANLVACGGPWSVLASELMAGQTRSKQL